MATIGFAVAIGVASGLLFKLIAPVTQSPKAKANRPDSWLEKRFPKLCDDPRVKLLSILACAGLGLVIFACFWLVAMASTNRSLSGDA